MKGVSKTGLIVSLSYFGIFLLSALLTFQQLIFYTAHSEFSGLFSILLTLPWSLGFAPFWNAVGYIGWYNQFADHALEYGFFAMIGLLPGALLNGAILYGIGMLFGRGPKKGN